MLSIVVASWLVGAGEPPPQIPPLIAPEAIVAEGFRRSRVVIMNEGHDGATRNINSRLVGMRILETARKAGASHLAVEALPGAGYAEQVNRTRELPPAEGGYLSQPEMRAFLQAALYMGFTLLAYEHTDIANGDLTKSTPEQRLALANARDEGQAENLARAFAKLPPNTKMLVWCGDAHVYEATERGWTYMAARFKKKSLVDPFTIDQTRALRWHKDTPESPVLGYYKAQLEKLPLNAGGFYAGAVPDKRYAKEVGADAFVVSLKDTLE